MCFVLLNLTQTLCLNVSFFQCDTNVNDCRDKGDSVGGGLSLSYPVAPVVSAAPQTAPSSASATLHAAQTQQNRQRSVRKNKPLFFF